MSFTFKLPVYILIGLIVFVLAEALYFLSKDHGDKDKMRVARALSLRVSLALVLFLVLIAGSFLGFVHPHGI
jgi:uncharacterized membrane protein SpoIIM required for sporulation